jgi:hypothetical protein
VDPEGRTPVEQPVEVLVVVRLLAMMRSSATSMVSDFV